MKKRLILALFVVFIVVCGVYYYKSVNYNKAAKHEYSELTAEVLNEIGGQEVADRLIANFEESELALQNAIAKYKADGSPEDAKPDVKLFAQFSRNAQYIRKYDVAIKALEDIFNYYDSSDIALINLASIYEDMGEYQKAIDTYLRFYDMYGVQIQQYHLDIITDYMALKDKENVIKYYNEFKNEGYYSEEVEQYIANS